MSLNLDNSLSNSRRHSANADVIADVTFSATSQKFKTIKIKPEKIPLYTQTNTCLLHFSRNFKDIFKYVYALRFIFSKL